MYIFCVYTILARQDVDEGHPRIIVRDNKALRESHPEMAPSGSCIPLESEPALAHIWVEAGYLRVQVDSETRLMVAGLRGPQPLTYSIVKNGWQGP